MAHRTHYTLPDPLLKLLFTEAQDGLRLLMERLLNLLMLAERQAYLQPNLTNAHRSAVTRLMASSPRPSRHA